MGLKEDFGDEPDTMLMYHYSYPESETPDVDSPSDVHKMYGALYYLLQCHDRLKKGDIIETQYGEFECQGCHLEPLFAMPPKPAKSTQPGNPFGDDLIINDSEGYTD
jgi:hypothetical protein